MMIKKIKSAQSGLTLIELLLGTALAFVAYSALVVAIPTVMKKRSDLLIQNTYTSSQVMRESMRSDLLTVGGAEIVKREDSQLHVCMYDSRSTDPTTCNLLTAINLNEQGLTQNFCVASASPFNPPNSDETTIKYFAYRGIGERLEYFYGDQLFGSLGENNLATKLEAICKAGYESVVPDISNSNWVLMNTPESSPLASFLVCGFSSGDFATVMSNSPPLSCQRVSNTHAAGAECVSGVDGAEGLILYTKFKTKLKNASEESFAEDVIVVPLLNKPCARTPAVPSN